MKMFDTIHKIEDFKKKIMGDPTNIAHLKKRSEELKEKLRLTIHEEALGEMTVKVSIVLTIPDKDVILRYYVGKKLFNRYFYDDKNNNENKKYRDFITECYNKAKEHFGEITEGYWSTD